MPTEGSGDGVNALLTPSKIKLEGGNNTLAIVWSDGHVSAYPYPYLRDRCPCASCTGHDYAPVGKPSEPALLPMFQKALKPERAELVGRYAVQIYWNDGHSTGIYSFDYLRELCPCGECTARRENLVHEEDERPG